MGTHQYTPHGIERRFANGTRVLLLVVLTLGLYVQPALGVVDLIFPAPNSTVDGLPVAAQFHDFVSYSLKLLDAYQDAGFIPDSYGDYVFATGTGTLDIKVLTDGDDTNDPEFGGTMYSFEDAQKNAAGGTDFYTRQWGNHNVVSPPPAQDPGPVLVKDLLSFLQAVDPDAVRPMFFFDMNQSQLDDLFVRGSVEILDGVDGTQLAEWIFDDGVGGRVLTPAEITIGSGDPLVDTPIVAASDSGNVYSVNNNQQGGSGKPDFAIYAPTMDLTLFDDENNVFVVNMEIGAPDGEFIGIDPFGQNTDGGDELFIAAGGQVIPEASSFAVWSLLVMCAAVSVGRARRSKNVGV